MARGAPAVSALAILHNLDVPFGYSRIHRRQSRRNYKLSFMDLTQGLTDTLLSHARPPMVRVQARPENPWIHPPLQGDCSFPRLDLSLHADGCQTALQPGPRTCLFMQLPITHLHLAALHCPPIAPPPKSATDLSTPISMSAHSITSIQVHKLEDNIKLNPPPSPNAIAPSHTQSLSNLHRCISQP